MSVWREFFLIFRDRNRELRRIADALDRIAPLPEEDTPELKPEEAVTYADEAELARQEQVEQAGELARWLEEHPEWAGVHEEDVQH